jgi:hypothetical protein
MPSGTVKKILSHASGQGHFGFIKPDADSGISYDVYFDNRSSTDVLYSGACVTFELHEKRVGLDPRPRASKVTLI